MMPMPTHRTVPVHETLMILYLKYPLLKEKNSRGTGIRESRETYISY